MVDIIKVSDIVPAEYNPRMISDDEFEKLSSSIGEFGLVDPIIINLNNNRIIGGHQRYDVLLANGIKELNLIKLGDIGWCFTSDDLKVEDDAHEKALNLALNKISGEWDNEKLDKLINELKLSDIDMEVTGFDDEELERFDFVDDDFIDEDFVDDDEELEVNTVGGDVYKLGNHRLMCGDSTNEKDVAKLMGGNIAKLIFTSPPYNMGADLYKNYKDNLGSKKYIDFNMDVINAYKKFLKGYLFWNISYNRNSRWEFIEIMYKIIKDKDFNFLELIVWDKGHGMPITSEDMLTRQYEDILMVTNDVEYYNEMELYCLGTTERKAYFNKKKGKGITNYWRISTNNSQQENHQACYPIGLPIKAIELTTDEGDCVIDCFGGTGTTLIACEKLKRSCFMMELDPYYCQLIINRWEEVTGKKAEKI